MEDEKKLIEISTKGQLLINERSYLKQNWADFKKYLDETEHLLKINEEQITQLLLIADAQEPSMLRKNVIQMLTKS